MRRANRLFDIIEYLRRAKRVVTAQELARELEVSVRTIYRDVADLQASRVPIEGEAGLGYVLRSGYELPPLMFTEDEIEALVFGARMVRAWGDAAFTGAADAAVAKIAAVLPEAISRQTERIEIHSIAPGMTEAVRERIDAIERATEMRLRLALDYADAEGARTERVVRPLGLWFWGRVWTLVAWCELREDFRMFRLDRIAAQPVNDKVLKLNVAVPDLHDAPLATAGYRRGNDNAVVILEIIALETGDGDGLGQQAIANGADILLVLAG